MTHYNDVVLPNTVRFGSSTRPKHGVDEMFARSGYRKTNRIWAEPLRTFRNLYKLQLVDIYALLETYHALGSSEDTGLLRDWTDWHTGTGNSMAAESAGNMVGDRVTAFDAPLMNPNLSPITNLGDASTTVFHAYKTYAKGATATNSFRIRHPVDDGSFKLGIGGVDVTGSATFSINEVNGEITITSPVPGDSPGDTVTWGGHFRRAFHFIGDEIEEVLRNRLVDTMRLDLQEAKNT